MSDHRLLADPGALVAGATVALDDEEAHHLRVRRAEAGQGAKVFDGAGVTARGVLERTGKGWQVALSEVASHPEVLALVLAVGAGDRDRFLALAEKCTELGVTRLVPLLTDRSVQVETRMRASAVERAQRRAREACKQSGNPWATVVDALTSIDLLADRVQGVQWLRADPNGVSAWSIAAERPLGWLIGPEGGFTDAEAAMTTNRLGASPVQLGPHVLRFDTAAVAAAGFTKPRARRE